MNLDPEDYQLFVLDKDPHHRSHSNLHGDSEYQIKSPGSSDQYEVTGSGDKYFLRIEYCDDSGLKDSVTKLMQRLDHVFPSMFKYYVKKKLVKGTYDIHLMQTEDMKQKG